MQLDSFALPRIGVSTMRLHLPSLLTGIAATASLIALLAADRPTPLLGRFELEATPSHVFVLDRNTGKVWQKFVTDGAGQTDQDFALPKVR